jgi:hypothetical protein
MERAAMDRIQHVIDDEVTKRFPEGAVRRAVLLQYGDDPVVEPGELMVRVLIEASGEPKNYGESLEAWAREHGTRMREFRRELAERLPEASRLEVTLDDPGVPYDHRPRWTVGGGGWLPYGGDGGDLTPVMARLGPVDLETLDALITAGFAANRAESVRWVLARIRERPAYAKLSEWVRELDELKAQF